MVKGINTDGTINVAYNGATFGVNVVNTYVPVIGQSALLLAVGTQIWAIGSGNQTPATPTPPAKKPAPTPAPPASSKQAFPNETGHGAPAIAGTPATWYEDLGSVGSYSGTYTSGLYTWIKGADVYGWTGWMVVGGLSNDPTPGISVNDADVNVLGYRTLTLSTSVDYGNALIAISGTGFPYLSLYTASGGAILLQFPHDGILWTQRRAPAHHYGITGR